MTENIIDKAKVDDHSVKPYRFKVLGSNVVDGATPLHVNEEYITENTFDSESKHVPDEIVNIARIEEGTQNQFIEELLKKTDELTTNVVKLQIQIEKQEQDFNNRLNEELTRERENAYAQGYQKAKEEFEEVTSEMKSRYLKSIGHLDTLYKSIEERLAKLETDMSVTAFEIAKEVIKKEVSVSSSKIAASLSKALLQEVKDAIKIELRVNPKDVEALKELYAEDEKIKVTSDDAITLGGVVILSDVGNLDGNLAMRLEKVKYLLQEN
ncbi:MULTISPECIES: flagellar assembly protein FliH [unclassified Sulfurospirillum]|uniref:flagellar assembly protein FliH n=1 Tax=unclassified Sulfurospirillum TaxID=2618290 RepID=UPI000503D4EA|nr:MULTISPECIES: flagellar assembly protein FliH [unclassified Sulfurospirillum]KFL34139.1 flagellar assembly protein FliH [Sulfurospirillum sp. SCADC]